MAEAAVIVLNYNGRAFLDACLNSLTALASPARLVLADNGSSDGSLAYVRERYPAVETLDLGRNLGFVSGYNAAIQQVAEPWLVLLNNDAVLQPDWVQILLHWAAEHPRAAVLGGKLLFEPTQPGNSSVLQSAGASFTDAGTAFEIGWGLPDQGQYEAARVVGAIPGAALLVRRDVFLELGGFDESYEAYLEDVDLCWRAWLRGYEVHYVPGAVAHHRYGASAGGRASAYRIRLMQQNRLTNMFKNLGAASLPLGLAVSAAYDIYRMLEYTRKGQMGALRALAGGTSAFSRRLGGLRVRRRLVQRSRVLSDDDLRRRGLLVPALSAFREYRRLDKVTR
jgi:GT2 family glycosyltransferase